MARPPERRQPPEDAHNPYLGYLEPAEKIRQEEEARRARPEMKQRQELRDLRDAAERHARARQRELGWGSSEVSPDLVREGVTSILQAIENEADEWLRWDADTDSLRTKLAGRSKDPDPRSSRPITGEPRPSSEALREIIKTNEEQIARLRAKTGFDSADTWVQHVESVARDLLAGLPATPAAQTVGSIGQWSSRDEMLLEVGSAIANGCPRTGAALARHFRYSREYFAKLRKQAGFERVSEMIVEAVGRYPAKDITE